MSQVSKTGLQACLTHKPIQPPPEKFPHRHQQFLDLKCEVTPAPYILRPYAGLYNPFPYACSVLCNHPTRTEAKDYVKRVKDAWHIEGRLGQITEEQHHSNKRVSIPHDIVTEDMFRRYTETDSRPLTPAPTLASGKSRGSRRCLTPDQPLQRTAIVLDLRRSHSQETLYYHGQTASESITNDRSTIPSLNLSEGAHLRLIKGPSRGPSEQLPPLASPLVLAKRTVKEPITARKNQLKALNLGKPKKPKATGAPATQRSKEEPNGSDELNGMADDAASGESRRRGKRRRKGRAGSDRMTSAGLAAQAQQDPETQIAAITSDSHNASSRGSIAAPIIDDVIAPLVPPLKVTARPKTDSFLDEDILKLLHREVDEDAIENEFDTKRRYVLEEALRTRPNRPPGEEMEALLKELNVPEVSLGDWLHIPRVFSRQNARFALPLDTNALEKLSPMQYAARYITLKKSKQLLYLTVSRKYRPVGYRMPKQDIPEGLILMMGGTVTKDQMSQYRDIMQWDAYEETDHNTDDIKLTLSTTGYHRPGSFRSGSNGGGDFAEPEENTIKYRTWCGLCAICERMYGRFPPRSKDPPDGMELSDFTMVETKLPALKVHKGLVEVLNAIRTL